MTEASRNAFSGAAFNSGNAHIDASET